MSERILLIDADVLAYEAASSCEKATEWEPGYWTWHCDFNEVVEKFDSLVKDIVGTLKGTPVFCLTDSDGNFRKSILPTYKGSRAKVKKPLVLKPFKEFLINERKAYFRPGLEGDDCMGILSTRSNPNGEERIIVSVDKDMKSIPGFVCRWPIETKPVFIEPAEADYWHLFQTLTGDATDGYSGCPGTGPKGAEKVLAPFAVDGKHSHMDVPAAWTAIVEAFEKAKLGETEALVQARVARILRASDYDFKQKAPILWTP